MKIGWYPHLGFVLLWTFLLARSLGMWFCYVLLWKYQQYQELDHFSTKNTYSSY